MGGQLLRVYNSTKDHFTYYLEMSVWWTAGARLIFIWCRTCLSLKLGASVCFILRLFGMGSIIERQQDRLGHFAGDFLSDHAVLTWSRTIVTTTVGYVSLSTRSVVALTIIILFGSVGRIIWQCGAQRKAFWGAWKAERPLIVGSCPPSEESK